MISSKKADFKLIAVMIIGMLGLLLMSHFFITQSEDVNDVIVGQFSDEFLEDFFDLPLTDGTNAIKYNAVSELDNEFVEYVDTIIRQIFDPEYERKEYKNSEKNLRYFDNYPTTDKMNNKNYGLQFIDSPQGVKIYIISETSQVYFYGDYRKYPFLENKHIALIESGGIYDSGTICTYDEELIGDQKNFVQYKTQSNVASFIPLTYEKIPGTTKACQDEAKGSFEAFALTWLFSRPTYSANGFLYYDPTTFVDSGYNFKSTSYNRINQMLDIWRTKDVMPSKIFKREPDGEVSQYIIPLRALELTTSKLEVLHLGKKIKVPEYAWISTFSDSIVKSRNLAFTKDFKGHLVLKLTKSDSINMAKTANQINQNENIDPEKSEYYVFFPAVRITDAVMNDEDPDLAVDVEIEGDKVKLEGIGFLSQISAKRIIENINLFK